MNISFLLNVSLFGISFLPSLFTNTQPSRPHLVILQFFFRFFSFLMWAIFVKSLLNLLQYCFCFMFWFFGARHVGS